MKIIFTFFFTILFSIFVDAQTSQDYAVMIQATVNESPATVTLKFNKIATTKQFRIYRKTKAANNWGNAIATLPSTATQYIDNAVTLGNAYEYNITRYDNAAVAYGYIYVGIKLPETTYRGKLLLMVDANYSSPLSTEIAQLQKDLIADGWQVKRFDINRNTTVTAVKLLIKNEVTADVNTKALYLLGRVPVPYSGGFKAATGFMYPPDGHPDHAGAWPADIYYGCFNESFWTDNSVNDTTASRTNNRNIPGDGKFDEMYILGYDSVKLQIGRVDLTNMTQFGMSDTLLVKQYLNKAHAFKTGQLATVRRGLVDDNFGPMGGEAFASTGWRDFSTMFGDSIFNRDYLTSIKNGNYLFTYGCGAGSYTTCSGIGASSDFNNDSINSVFTMLFGSYFGDWDSPNNFLRAPLCSRPASLASVWSGRPHWQFHHMSLGETIGYSTWLTQNNYYDTTSGVIGYTYNIYPTFTHVSLMGDPSLRLHAMKPVASIKSLAATDSLSVRISWTPSTDATDGYVILTSRSLNGRFIVVGKALSIDTVFVHTAPGYGINYYSVRPLKLENTPSGTYYNLALGVIDSAYSKNRMGVYDLAKTTLNASVYPNPNNGNFTVFVNENSSQQAIINCYDMTGKLLKQIATNQFATDVNLNGIKGLILVRIIQGNMEITKKVLLLE